MTRSGFRRPSTVGRGVEVVAAFVPVHATVSADPLTGWLGTHDSAAAADCLHEAFGFQHSDSTAGGQHRDAVLGRQVGESGQCCSRSEFAPQDRGPQHVGELLVAGWTHHRSFHR